MLSDLDAKIEINNKINQELEAMAKTLYDYWFVQFDFPDANGKPYKSSDGKMVYNDELKREIPEGWESCLLGDVVSKTGTGLNPRKHFVLGEGENYYVTIKNINQGQVVLDHRCDKISDKSLEIINNRSDLRVGDILYTSIEPVGITYLLRNKPKNWNINESVFTIRADYEKVSSEFLYMFLSGDYIKAYTKNVSAGSIHKGVRHSTLKECKFILPKKEIIDSFTNKLNPILDKLELIQKENQKLSELRNWLLPMLMNGQVTVGSAEKEVEVLQMITPNPYNPSAAIIGTHIVKHLENSPGMGRTKFQKVLHLAEYNCKTVLGGLYYQKTAGPHNDILINHIESKFRQMGHVKVSRDIVNGKKHFVYNTTVRTAESETAYKNLSKDYRTQIDSLIDILKPLTLKETEAISTLYAVWNNRIIQNQEINNRDLFKDFYNWSERKKKEFVDRDIIIALDTMKRHNIIPSGWGDYIGKE